MMRNPCIDPQYTSILSTFVTDQTYQLGAAPIEFQHFGADLVTSPNQHSLCGDLTFVVWFVDDYVGPTSKPLSYDSDTFTMTFETSDSSLVG